MKIKFAWQLLYTPSVLSFINSDKLVLEVKQADRWTDRSIDVTPPLSVHFLHFVQVIHKNGCKVNLLLRRWLSSELLLCIVW
jgi:hypothetical protein